MHISINKDELALAIKYVILALPKKTLTEILENIYIEATEQAVQFTTNNLDIAFTYLIQPSSHRLIIFKTGKTLLSGKSFKTLLQKIQSRFVEIEAIDTHVTIKADRFMYKADTMDPTNYPKIKHKSNLLGVVKIRSNDLEQLITQSLYATSKNNTQVILTGVLCQMQEHTMTFITCDRYRAAKVTRQLYEKNASFRQEIILSGTLLTILNKIILHDEIIEFHMYEDTIEIQFASTLLICYSKLLNGTFPNVTPIFDTKTESSFHIKKSELLDSLERIAVFVSKKFKGVQLHADHEIEKLSAKNDNPNINQALEEIEIQKFFGSSFSLLCNIQYLLDVLKIIKTENLLFQYSGHLKPISIQPDIDPHSIHIILPMNQRNVQRS